MSTFLNRLAQSAATRVLIDSAFAGTPIYHDGLVYGASDRLVCNYAGTAAYYLAGIGLTAAGELCVFDASAGLPADTFWQSGLPISVAQKRLCVDPTNAVSYWHQGVPFTTVGAVAVDGTAPPATCVTPSVILTKAFDNATGAITQFEINAKSFQSFSFVAGAMVTDLHWTGGTTVAAEPFLPTAWLIEFWNNNAGVPGTLNQTAVFSPALANITSIGSVEGDTINGFTFSIDILPWFLADAGVTYWVSVQPHLQLPQNFYWLSGGAGSSFTDFAGTPVPNAFALALDITGCLGR